MMDAGVLSEPSVKRKKHIQLNVISTVDVWQR